MCVSYKKTVVKATGNTEGVVLPLCVAGEDEMFSKLLTCSQEQTLQLIVRPEREALVSQLTSLANDELSELCFIEQALEELKVQTHCCLGLNLLCVCVWIQVREADLTALSDGYVERDATLAFSGSEDGGGEEREGGEGGSASSSMSEETLLTVQTDDSLGVG